jgi:hypothetical protein
MKNFLTKLFFSLIILNASSVFAAETKLNPNGITTIEITLEKGKVELVVSGAMSANVVDLIYDSTGKDFPEVQKRINDVIHDNSFSGFYPTAYEILPETKVYPKSSELWPTLILDGDSTRPDIQSATGYSTIKIRCLIPIARNIAIANGIAFPNIDPWDAGEINCNELTGP